VTGNRFTSAYQTTCVTRRETFLADYSRNLKMFLTVVILLLFASPVYINAYISNQRSYNEDGEYIGPLVVPALTTRQPNFKDAEAEMATQKAAPGPLSDEEKEAMRSNDARDSTTRLAPAPDAELIEATPKGLLPKIGEGGKTPWQTYARPFNGLDRRPRIAIVMADMGLSLDTTDAALQKLPAAVTLAFDIQSPVVGSWLSRARQNGHETILALPMEPFDYPRSDPGPNTLLTNLPNGENLQRFLWALRQGSGYVGVTTFSGSRFTADPDKLTPVLQSLRQRGLLVLDARLSPHSALHELCKQNFIPVANSTLQIDAEPSEASIDAALEQLEKTANLTGRAIGIASPLPKTIEKLQAWINKLPDNGIVLAPLSSTVEQ